MMMRFVVPAVVLCAVSLLLFDCPNTRVDDYADRCIIATKSTLPVGTQVMSVATKSAAPALVIALEHDPDLRWVEVDLMLASAGTTVAKSFLCAEARWRGHHAVVPVDRSGPPPANTYVVED